MQLKYICFDVDGGYLMFLENCVYMVVLIIYEEIIDFWCCGLVEQMVVGLCVQVNIWGENVSEWIEVIDIVNVFVIMIEECSEIYFDIVVSL